MAVAKLVAKKSRLMTVTEYLTSERAAFERSEYIDGEVYLMPGESGAHADISVNLIGMLHSQLKGKKCRARAKETKVKTGGPSPKAGANSMKGMFSYPDILVVCGEPKYHDKQKDVVLNPKVVIEVLSKSTEKFNCEGKFMRYRMFNETLSDYILVAHDKPMVERYVRQDDNSWKIYTHIGLDAVCAIDSIECTLPLLDIYDRVEFTKEGLAFLREIAGE